MTTSTEYQERLQFCRLQTLQVLEAHVQTWMEKGVEEADVLRAISDTAARLPKLWHAEALERTD